MVFYLCSIILQKYLFMKQSKVRRISREIAKYSEDSMQFYNYSPNLNIGIIILKDLFVKMLNSVRWSGMLHSVQK